MAHDCGPQMFCVCSMSFYSLISGRVSMFFQEFSSGSTQTDWCLQS